MENLSAGSSADPARAGFTTWLNSATGSILAGYEQEKIAGIITGLFGYHIIQMGRYGDGTLAAAGRIRNKIELRLAEDGLQDCGCGVLSSSAALPFAAHSVDVVLLPHVLEFAPDPGAVLKEIDRVLIEDGRLIVAGFNPWSLWGLWRLLPARRKLPPWNCRFHGTARLKQWLAVLGYEFLAVDRFLFRPPFRHESLLRRSVFLEKLGKTCWPFFGAAYIVVAQKRRAPVTPIKMSWRKKTLVPGASTGPVTNIQGDL